MRAIFDISRDGMSAINMAADQMARAQEELSTGKAVVRPSDDPAAAARAVGEHAALSSIAAYSSATDAASSRESAADSVMGDIVDKITAALTAATSAGGTTAQSVRDAAAGTLQGLRDALSGDINFQFQGTYIFSGSKTDQPSYAQVNGVWTYQGDSTTVQTSIDTGRQVNQTWNGQSIFQGSASQNLLTVLDNLVRAVQSEDKNGI